MERERDAWFGCHGHSGLEPLSWYDFSTEFTTIVFMILHRIHKTGVEFDGITMQFSLGSDVALERETNLHTSVVGYSVSTGKIVPVLIKYLHQAQAYTSPSVLGFTTESFNGNTRANTLKRKSPVSYSLEECLDAQAAAERTFPPQV